MGCAWAWFLPLELRVGPHQVSLCSPLEGSYWDGAPELLTQLLFSTDALESLGCVHSPVRELQQLFLGPDGEGGPREGRDPVWDHPGADWSGWDLNPGLSDSRVPIFRPFFPSLFPFHILSLSLSDIHWTSLGQSESLAPSPPHFWGAGCTRYRAGCTRDPVTRCLATDGLVHSAALTMLHSRLHSPASLFKFQGHQGYLRTCYNADCPAPPPKVLVQLARAGTGTLNFLQLPRLSAAGALTLKILCNRRTDVRRKARASSGGLESLMMKVKFFPEKENHLKENCIKEDDFEKSGLLGA